MHGANTETTGDEEVPGGGPPQGRGADLTAAVRQARAGDEAAFRLVYRAVHPRLLAYVRSLVGPAHAEDVASDAWLQIARDLRSFRGDGDRFPAWATRVARNRAYDHLRRAGRSPLVGGDESVLTGLAAAEDTAGEALEAVATGEALAMVARLPRDQAEAVLLRVVVGLDAKSTARVLGKRPGAVRMAAHRGLRRLAEMLDGRERSGAAGARAGRGRT
ncbi:RNA polymerase sigma factor [Streptomyces thermolineatus]|uniref:RNA polymerase sigma factor n=1 Tax=Streptomyces thermolineatus TaxID=44033 RepID=A0ABP5ZZ99_9ACTN